MSLSTYGKAGGRKSKSGLSEHKKSLSEAVVAAYLPSPAAHADDANGPGNAAQDT